MKNIFRKTLSLTLSLLLTLSLMTTAIAATTFTDVPADHWASSYIDAMSERGVVNGYGNGKFGPEDSVSAAHFATMLSRAFFSDTLGEATDVWYENHLANATAHKVMNGTSMHNAYLASGAYNTEELNAPLLRYDMAQMMYNTLTALGVKMPSASELEASKAKITDIASIPDKYTTAVVAMYTLGQLTGFGDGSFGGDTAMTRAQSCAVMSRLIDAAEKKAEEDASKPVLKFDEKGKYVGEYIPVTKTVEDIAPGVEESERYKNSVEFYSREGYEFELTVTDAAEVNAACDVGKCNAFPTVGFAAEPNVNGYHTFNQASVEGAYLVYEALDIFNEYRREIGAPEFAWTTVETDEEMTLVDLRYLDTRATSITKADSIEEAVYNMWNDVDGCYKSVFRLQSKDRIKYIAAACYETGGEKYYAFNFSSGNNPLSSVGMSADSYRVFE